MTVRVYLAAAKCVAGPPEPTDILAERLFIHASELPEFWVETESLSVPGPGKSVAFSIAWPADLGFERIEGTVERVISKATGERLNPEK